MEKIASASSLKFLARIADNSSKPILTLLLISFIISLIFIIIQNYVLDENSIWILTVTYINIIIITLCFVIYVRSLYANNQVE
ncbi:hypothetical protein [Alphaentomopoxvirus acuprea]|uniref:Uncharacterized protein n=1 Tax=Alphaentomopoxvirus acuprea TaxID=62099 RepID=W6JKY5_9POXV|nr:hypothetical protein BA82_gp090 [Anomala cuprea entomopoxvirus]BAO49450.1 hypothetical protein [Anomala cuprea entomopoxvirus]